MSTHLHDLDVLHDLASGPPGIARDWANVRLALRAPSRVTGLPEDPYDAALVMVAGAPAAAGAVRAGLRGAETTAQAAIRAEQLSAFALVPDASEDWVEALGHAIVGDGRVADLYLTQLLADFGALDGRALSAASRVSSLDATVALPALVVRFATPQGQGDAAAEAVVAQLKAKGSKPSVAVNVLALLGVPHLLPSAADERGVVEQIAAWMGAPAPEARAGKGAARRRAQKWVRQLLEGVEGEAASMARALSAAELGDPTVLVASAAWIRLRTDGAAPLDAVLDQHAGEDRRLLSAARRAVSADDDARIRRALADPLLELCPPSLLVADRTVQDVAPHWLDDLLERYVRHPNIDLRSDMVTTLVFGRVPDRVAQLLGDRSTRTVALLFARLAGTEAVLAALLDMPVPGDGDERELYVQALAEMADPSVLPVLRRLADSDGSKAVQDAWALANALLGR